MKSSLHLKLGGAALLLASFTFGAGAQSSSSAQAQLKDQSGQSVGSAELMETRGGLLIRIELANLKPGTHAVHIHAVGKCDPPSFESAGGHFNPGNQRHGILAGEGHAGDLPNLHVPDNGQLKVELVTDKVTLESGKPNSLLDADGSSLVLHANADDYRSDPAGNSGGRIACGVITIEPTVGGPAAR